MARGQGWLVGLLVVTAAAFLSAGWIVASSLTPQGDTFVLAEGDEMRASGPFCIVVDGDIRIDGAMVGDRDMVLVSRHGDIRVDGRVQALDAIAHPPGDGGDVWLVAPEGRVDATGVVQGGAGAPGVASAGLLGVPLAALGGDGGDIHVVGQAGDLSGLHPGSAGLGDAGDGTAGAVLAGDAPLPTWCPAL